MGRELMLLSRVTADMQRVMHQSPKGHVYSVSRRRKQTRGQVDKVPMI